MLNAVDGCIPSDLGTVSTEEIEEERRLLYVAMTRARDSLHLIVPQSFFTSGQRAWAIATSVRRGRASFQMASCRFSSLWPGQRRNRKTPSVAFPRELPAQMSELACAPCGDSGRVDESVFTSARKCWLWRGVDR